MTGIFDNSTVFTAVDNQIIEWQVLYDSASVSVEVASIAPGSADFDSDGDVDGADFLSWQRNDGTAANLALWENNFGVGGTALASSAASVPEPTTILLSSFFVIVVTLRRRLTH